MEFYGRSDGLGNCYAVWIIVKEERAWVAIIQRSASLGMRIHQDISKRHGRELNM